MSQEPASDDVASAPQRAKFTSKSDTEMESEDQEPTPRPRKNGNWPSSAEEVEEVDLEDDEHFRTPHTLKQKKISIGVITIDSSELSELPSEESELEDKGKKKKTTMGVKGSKLLEVTINLTYHT